MQVTYKYNLKMSHLYRCLHCYLRPLSLKVVNVKPVIRTYPGFPVRKVCSSDAVLTKAAFDINTNVVKEVVLFRYENTKLFRILNVFALCQFGFWTYLAHFAFTSLKDIPVPKDENLPWWRRINLGEKKYRITLTTISFFIGYGILAASWFFTLKSVRYLVLRKGGQEITLITYGPFGKNRMTTVNLNHVSCEQSRSSARVQLPLKVKGSFLYYILDMRGEFMNPRLFDYTAGIKRTLAN